MLTNRLIQSVLRQQLPKVQAPLRVANTSFLSSSSARGILSATKQVRSLPFSSAATAPQKQTDDPKHSAKRKRRATSTIDKKDPIILTQRAADRIHELLQGENAQGALGIRIGVKRRGCNGLSYTLNYVTEEHPKDVQMEAHGVKLYIEPMALFSIVGTTMDWEESDLTSEFTFQNPNSKGECGCGESFTV